MSSTSTIPTPPPNPSNFPGGGNGGGGGGGGGGNQTSNLYLYTFLATLLLLLTISVLIVGRSIIIRRRARRVIEEAVRNGTFHPQAGRPAAKFGEKPKLFDVYTTAGGIPGRSPADDSSLAWGDLKPLSVMLKKPAYPSPQGPAVRSPTPTEPPPSLLLRLVPQLRPPVQATVPGSSTHPLETLQPPRKPTVTISVMITMPTPPTTKPRNSSEGIFPPVQVGVTHLPIPQGWAMNGKSDYS